MAEVILVVIFFAIFGLCTWAGMRAEDRRAAEEQERKQVEMEKRRKEYEQQKALEMAEQVRKDEEEKRLRQIRLEEKQKEIEERILRHKESMIGAWEALGIDDMSLDSEMYTISVREDVDVSLLFKIIREYMHYNNYKFIVNQLNGEPLLEFILRPSFWIDVDSIVFANEEIPNKRFKGDTQIERLAKMEKFLFCHLSNRRLVREKQQWNNILLNGVDNCALLKSSKDNIEEYANDVLMKSNYEELFEKNVSTYFENNVLMVDYRLPNREDFMDIKEYKYIARTNEINELHYPATVVAKEYERALYSICLRSIYELLNVGMQEQIKSVVFNGVVLSISPATGKLEHKCIMSISVNRETFNNIDITQVDPKICFKSLKGVSATKLINLTPITPVLVIQRDDRRFVKGREVVVDGATNLASMNWEDFEHLVRELFETEFSQNGGEVKVTQASRDGGVDAVAFDPDPLRGGKIVIQAKRYTNTVSVLAVRDLYGTVINEGANSGILITTSDYGHDSYEFAKDKPLKLLNGGHLLSLLNKHGKKAYIDMQEAKELNGKQI